jgi:isocitrate lyase
MIEEIGADSIILARTDSEAAITWALKHGIRRFQGFFIDHLIERQRAANRR